MVRKFAVVMICLHVGMGHNVAWEPINVGWLLHTLILSVVHGLDHYIV